MYYEIRTYKIKTGAVPAYLKLVEEEGIELQKRYLGELVGYFFSELGPLNQIVHMWAYPSLDEREARRQRLAADPAWQAFVPKIQALMETMESKIMKPAAFSPLK
ncbi:NIPSNAP family containing protein [Paraburkholderia ribeironis]|uniref:NIPSNAP family containing protein n=1 Tax=Paraburkholderia ribeironis TaxID=1247936 RepID=A0A1N7RQD0_9BURK|nr:NIPSNAP family protein [Paraburkholderia ribeironis]SIT37335.1 NIPSNAP family containing protein [Paraburkholderia ribeironis]